MLTDKSLDAVFDILVEECGASSVMREEFKLNWPECIEYRFQGLLGFGGKVWAGTVGRPPYVSCYLEDRTPKRDEMIQAANQRLFEELEH
jgi:hypothetical protein